MPLDASSVDAAVEVLRPVVRRTSLERSDRLSEAVGVDVLLKREDLQRCRSYKVRGAYNLMPSLDADQRAGGVVCASAGNHGQGVAYSCQPWSSTGRVFVPTSTPRQKRQRIQAMGGDLGGAGLRRKLPTTRPVRRPSRTAGAPGAVYVHAFDDPRTIAGQGTVAVEIAEQCDGPIGTLRGAGGRGRPDRRGRPVAAGTTCPDIRIVGAEPAGRPAWRAALAARRARSTSTRLDTFVDGAAVARVGELTFRIVRDLVDEVVTVAEGAVCTEMLDLYQSDGIIAEPAGALASAALPASATPRWPGPVVCVVSGGNNDVSRYAEIVERSLIHQGLRHYFLVTFPQEPGALRRFLDELLVARGGHRRSSST